MRHQTQYHKYHLSLFLHSSSFIFMTYCRMYVSLIILLPYLLACLAKIDLLKCGRSLTIFAESIPQPCKLLQCSHTFLKNGDEFSLLFCKNNKSLKRMAFLPQKSPSPPWSASRQRAPTSLVQYHTPAGFGALFIFISHSAPVLWELWLSDVTDFWRRAKKRLPYAIIPSFRLRSLSLLALLCLFCVL